MNLIGKYTNGNYIVEIWDDGTKMRYTQATEFVPEFPESLDINLTYRCDGKCPFCYAGATLNGKHAVLFKEDGSIAWPFLETLRPYTEVALNANDLSLPDLDKFLEWLRSRNILANLTINQKHFNQNYDRLREWSDNGLIRGLGVSLSDSTDTDTIEKIASFPNAVVHTIVGVLSRKDLDNLSNKNIRLLLLGYKQCGRGNKYYSSHSKSIDINTEYLGNRLKDKEFLSKFQVISFDNLAIHQLDIKNKLFANDQKGWEMFYAGDDGSCTFYVDLVKGRFGQNSVDYDKQSYDVLDTIDAMFEKIRVKYE